jgi:hypothetical protein
MNCFVDQLRSLAIDHQHQEQLLEQQIEQLFDQQQTTLAERLNVTCRQLSDSNLLVDDLKQLQSRLTLAATLAGNVSATVRRIDCARAKAADCLARVDDVLELKHAARHVRDALQASEFERAAGHVQRFRSIDFGAIRNSASQLTGTQERFALFYDDQFTNQYE